MDERTQITAATRNVPFAVYAPVGIAAQAVLTHLKDIRDYVLVVAPTAEVRSVRVASA